MQERLSGQELMSRVNRAFTLMMIVSQGIGSVVSFVYITLLLPVNPAPPLGKVILWNWPLGAAYVLMGSIVGPLWGRAIARRELAWLVEDRSPNPAEQRRALLGPVVQIKTVVVLWAIGACLFGLVNLHFSVPFAENVAGGIVAGGLVTCGISYLLAERVLRPITVRALECGPPVRPAAPGVLVRTMLAWTLGAGVPLVGIASVAGGILTGDTPRSNATAWSLVILALAGLVTGTIAIVIAAKSIAEPLRAVRRALARVQEGDIDVEVPVDDASEVGLLQAGFNRMAAGLRERERLRDLFGRHVGEDVARQALEAGVELGGEVREAAVVFVDVVGSTTLAAEAPPEEVVRRLNGFFALVLEVVRACGGWVNKFEGDAALCVFGVPTAIQDPAGRALAAARELAARIEAESPLVAGVGVSAGEVVAGNVGAEHRFEYTVIGDAVNEAARLTELAKERQPRVLASGRAVARAGDEAERWALAEEVTLRGRLEPTRLAVPVESAVPA